MVVLPIAFALVFGEAACEGPASNARIITAYRAAACIPLAKRRATTPRTREWDTALSLRDGMTVVVHGADAPGSGVITLSYPAENIEVVAANGGDYVYPTDVRVDFQKEILYVKAYGLAGGISEKTLLFGYDLRRKQLMERLRVGNDVLTEECPE